MVDLDPADTPAAAASVAAFSIAEGGGEDQTAFRDGQRHVLRLARRTKTVSKPERVPVRPDATYLITGGLGGIGLIIARWLADRGARHLILAGRNSLPIAKSGMVSRAERSKAPESPQYADWRAWV